MVNTKTPVKKTEKKTIKEKTKKVSTPVVKKDIIKEEKEVMKRKLSGIVVSDKMNKTIVVKVERVVIHPKYKKRYSVRKSYKVHDEKESFKIGDKVTFVECRPLSKEKKWRVIYN